MEAPGHGRDPSRMDGEELLGLVQAYQLRYRSMMENPEVRRVFLFRNHGRDAGASLPHPHAQLVGVAFLPPELARRERALEDRIRSGGGCPLCGISREEPEWGRRNVCSTEKFHLLVPWAAEAPYELWVVPRQHRSSFGDAGASDLEDLAFLLGRSLRLYRTALGSLPYNLMLHSGGRRGDDGGGHWWLQLRPRVGHPAGFEMASGVFINAGAPEEHGEELQRAWREREPSANHGGKGDGKR